MILFQIDKIETLKPATDTSLMMMKRFLREGFDVRFYYISDLFFSEDRVFANCFMFNGSQSDDGVKTKIDIDSDCHLLFIRQDPPFDMSYTTPLYLLSMLKKCNVINDPRSILLCPEKLFVLNFKDFIPKTLISASLDEITLFWKKNGNIIVKPLYGHAGSGVFLIRKDDKNLLNTVRLFFERYGNIPLIAQEYLERVKNGDKRILFVDGEVVGSINRIQGNDHAISAVAFCDDVVECDLTEHEMNIASKISPFVKDLKLFLAGIDVIDGRVTEINVTSPTGYVLFQTLSGKNVDDIIFDKICKSYL